MQFIAAEDYPSDETVLECVTDAVSVLGVDGLLNGAQLAADIIRTVNTLLQERRRCLEMTNERLRDICITTWRIDVIREALRLRSEVAAVAGEDAAQIFFESFLGCFGIDPNDPDVPQRRKFFM